MHVISAIKMRQKKDLVRAGLSPSKCQILSILTLMRLWKGDTSETESQIATGHSSSHRPALKQDGSKRIPPAFCMTRMPSHTCLAA